MRSHNKNRKLAEGNEPAAATFIFYVDDDDDDDDNIMSSPTEVSDRQPGTDIADTDYRSALAPQRYE